MSHSLRNESKKQIRIIYIKYKVPNNQQITAR